MSTITREFTKEQLQQIIETDHVQCGEASALARIAMASLEAEPVAYMNRFTGRVFTLEEQPGADTDAQVYMPVYTTPPAPVSVPDEATPENIEILASTFAPRGVTYQWDRDERNAAADSWNACRAAMLQGADVSLTHEGKNHHEDKLGMVNHLGDVTEKVEPVTQIEPVADLYGLTSSTGGETSFTFDAVEARDFIDGGWSCQEYVELGRFQEAMLQNGNSPAQSDCCPEQNYIAPAQDGNSPVIPDGWALVPIEPTEHMIVEGFESEPDEFFSDEEVWEAYDAMSGCQQAAHRAKLCWAAMIAAAPKLE